ncbi:MAG: hypothetical protein Q8M40_01025 [Legionella sp.]|nr:hypothetical protein [Legionella sp.]
MAPAEIDKFPVIRFAITGYDLQILPKVARIRRSRNTGVAMA